MTRCYALSAALVLACGAALADTIPVPPRAALSEELTQAEQDMLRVGVMQCWNTGALTPEALAVLVTVGADLSRDGRVVPASVTLVSATGSDPVATEQAYDAARRALLRCGAQGFDLPPMKYDQWRRLELTFDATVGVFR